MNKRMTHSARYMFYPGMVAGKQMIEAPRLLQLRRTERYWRTVTESMFNPATGWEHLPKKFAGIRARKLLLDTIREIDP